MRRLLVIAWSESLRCPSHRIVRVIAWSESSHGPSHRMVRVIAWSESSHGPSHRMIRVIAWSESSHGPSHRMVRVTAWSESLHGPSHRMVGRFTTTNVRSCEGLQRNRFRTMQQNACRLSETEERVRAGPASQARLFKMLQNSPVPPSRLCPAEPTSHVCH